MKPTFDKIFVLMLLVAFLAVASASPTGAQSPEPPEILENGEFPLAKLNNLSAVDSVSIAVF